MEQLTAAQLNIALGSVYDPPDDPYRRLLVMRRWPRGVPKDAVDDWERALGPSDELLDAYNDGDVPWDEFAKRYREEMAERSVLIAWVTRLASLNGITLLCGSHPEAECHRSLLAELVREHAARAS
jgi:uncharacterized protein YeaO (DUF488 family)